MVSFGTDRDVLIRLPHGYSDQVRCASAGEVCRRPLTAPSSCGGSNSSVPRSGTNCGNRRSGHVAGPGAGDAVHLLPFQFKFAVGAVVALIHDVIITLGFFSFTRMEFDLTVLAALMAVIGYSINDTIVVFDRIGKFPQGAAHRAG